MKINTTPVYLTYFLYISFFSISDCKANDNNLAQFEDTCITKIKNFEQDMQATFKDFHDKIAHELDLKKENAYKIFNNQNTKTIDADSSLEKVEAEKNKIHEKLESGKATAAEKIDHAKEKITNYIEIGKDKAHQAIEASKQKTREIIAKAQDSVPQHIKQAAETTKHNIEDGTHKLHDTMVAGKDAIIYNAQIAKEKLKDGFQSGKHTLETGFATAAQQLQQMKEISTLFPPYEYSAYHIEFVNSDRKIKISEEKTSTSTKYIIEDMHKNGNNLHQQKDSNISYLKSLQKYLKKHFDSKTGQIALKDCIRSITYKPNTKHISVINSHKDQQEKYFIEVTPKKQDQRFKGRNKKEQEALYNITYAHNPTIIS